MECQTKIGNVASPTKKKMFEQHFPNFLAGIPRGPVFHIESDDGSDPIMGYQDPKRLSRFAEYVERDTWGHASAKRMDRPSP